MDMGATHAAILFFRRPDLFSGVLALSGIYDSSYYYHGWMDSTLYDNSVECFLSNMPDDHPWIRKYNNCFMVFCCGRGLWEDKCCETLMNLEKIFRKKRISAFVDYWGYDVSHDWQWWKHQLEYFVPHLLDQHSFITEL
jgi:esterase/lipase superfamily enzyme